LRQLKAASRRMRIVSKRFYEGTLCLPTG